MIRVPMIVKCLLRGMPAYKFGGHQEVDRDRIKLREDKTGYFLNPNETARRTMRVIAQHEKVKDPEAITLSTQWHQIGLNELDLVELFIGIENQFCIEFPDDVSQKFKDVHDAVQYISRSFWAH